MGLYLKDVDGLKSLTPRNTQLNNFVGATAEDDGKKGLVPSPTKADKDKFLCADGTWKEIVENVNFITDEQIKGLFTDDNEDVLSWE